ncbi:PTS sugar transporter subunit IIA [Lentilactobacillus sp. Marseille-Q4993]|uniref:PTS sugar transporter subunit IIA n=1 Tax=Lentilactobacillus sp. Marseille-Q4993 TaxID=3039492 RepID=UPI0024BC4DA8|nr:PTS sugar transporter subunit IIA [Lentilactobacillus sp. Marseille-Q4993]
MLSIIVATHGGFGAELINSAEIIFGHREKVYPISMDPSFGLDKVKEVFSTTLAEIGNNKVVILTDLFGGTPFNVAAQFVAEDHDRRALISGVSLPMLIEAFQANESESLNEVCNRLIETAQTGIRQFELHNNDSEDDL